VLHSPIAPPGSLITILPWVYHSSIIFFLGAEFTLVYTSALRFRS
jgi:uncharacterized BrkB/YihY/UPF0761 family membrane protein